VWRMRDPDERAASLALRDGGPASVRRAIGWYRTHDRLRCGDQITMAADALTAYQADTAAGSDALLVCDTTEMADALNQRLHTETIGAQADTVTAARGHRIGAGDLILTRRNDPSIRLDNNDPAAEKSPVRNGQRWQVTRINSNNNRLIARRLDDNTLGAFNEAYVCEHITYGYAVTVHFAQGVTADTTHAVLSEKATRALSYVALT
jgi:ATP-dependent exoDNAse (exonuclease V) alpha subunit